MQLACDYSYLKEHFPKQVEEVLASVKKGKNKTISVRASATDSR
jgi:hypothetical protein